MDDLFSTLAPLIRSATVSRATMIRVSDLDDEVGRNQRFQPLE